MIKIILMAALLVQIITTTQNVSAVELFEFDDFALYVPAEVSTPRGILLALGGPDTRAFVTGGRFGAPNPELEAALHVLGEELRTLAAHHALALLGTSRAALPNNRESDKQIIKAIREASARSGHPELKNAPLFLYGISGGTLQGFGFTVRNPERVGALFLKFPGVPDHLSSVEALAVPTYLMLAERDTFADNKSVVAAFNANRGAGALWALAIEPNVAHHSLTPSHRDITINWMRAIVQLRLGTSAGEPLRKVSESSGWLGDPVIGVTNWVSYPGNRRAANWFPSQATAEEWETFITRKQ